MGVMYIAFAVGILSLYTTRTRTYAFYVFQLVPIPAEPRVLFECCALTEQFPRKGYLFVITSSIIAPTISSISNNINFRFVVFF